MPKKLKVEGATPPQEIIAARRKTANPFDHERLLAIQMAQQGGWHIADIAKTLDPGHATIERWIRAYRQSGIDGLLKKKHHTRKPRLSPDDIDALSQGLLSGRFKRAKEIRQWLKKERGIKMTLSGVYYWLNKLTGRHKVPRKVHDKQDPKQKDAFKENIVAKLNTLEIPPNKPVCIWVEDEHRYGLISNIRRCWTLAGHRVTVPYQTKYQWA